MSDALISPAYFRFVYEYDPRWIFLLSANSQTEGKDRIGRLEGLVRIFRKADWKAGADGEYLETGKVNLNTPKNIVNNIYRLVDKDNFSSADRAQKLREQISSNAEVLNKAAVFIIKCEITRTGIVTVTEEQRRDDVAFSSSITDIPTNIDEKSSRYICNQAFFFLKDVAHTHRHHHPRSDTITAAYPSDREGSWIRETQYSIHRRVVTLRRNPRPLNLYDSLGIMAYMASFSKIIEDTMPKTAGSSIALQYNLSELESSIKATLESRRWGRIQANLVITAIPALLIAFAGLLRPLPQSSTGNQKISIPNITLFDSSREIISGLLTPDIYGLATVIIFLAVVPFLYGLIDPRRVIFVMNAKRIMTVWSRARQSVIWVGLALIPFCAIIYLIEAAYNGTSSRQIAWTVTIVTITVLATGLVIFPYLFTFPDLWIRLRGRDPLADRRMEQLAQ